jgi:hypothetical protein
MAARSRPRGGQLKEEFDEERSLWNQIRSDARRIDQLMVRYIPLSFTTAEQRQIYTMSACIECVHGSAYGVFYTACFTTSSGPTG